ncbi:MULTISPECIES: type 1 fimbrial protein [Klebsiella]|uniref:type 1 fimbrial protein n=1 Tax=Klebsiella TaxID=570 RepID=UPI00062C182C|nr:type 1 fimbrial protein [Klebsiella michiganensis]ELN3893306.1 type 1 fimbrial protein [Klebsiella michiganensis]ELS5411920.1 type 1 fimbrial protein [Klebsiella michiganensis]KKY76042.1 fimbrial protein [Klebsiella michiganensis]MBZ7105983.1 type 1 fimbrial protein [Klebsiella michiganensis]MCW9619071.1 type 1 fimbrial protein [Klebsiella michiganensis]
MKTFILLLLACLLPTYSWACQTGANSGDIALTNLPAQVLVNAGSYSAGTILYDSGQITHPTTSITDCRGWLYALFGWSSGNAGTLVGDNIYSTSVQGIGIRVKFWLNITGEYGGDNNDFNADYSVHHIGDADLYLGKPNGLFDDKASTYYAPTYQVQLVATGGAIASNSTLTLADPISTVSILDLDGTMAISQLHVTGSTKIQLTPMGCSVDSTALNFQMGSVKTSEFNLSNKAGSAQQTLTLTCEPGTFVAMRVTAPEAEGDNSDHTVIALTSGENVATGVGVQLNLYNTPLIVNNAIYRVFSESKRTTVTNPGSEASYTIFTDPDNPGGAAASNVLTFTANYYKTGSNVTPGTANASGTITFTYQ